MTDLKAFRLKGERVKLDSEEFFFVKASILNSQTTVRVRTAWNKRLPNKSSDCEPRTERSLDIACSISTQPGPIIAESMYTLPLLSQLNWDLLCSSPQFAHRRDVSHRRTVLIFCHLIYQSHQKPSSYTVSPFWGMQQCHICHIIPLSQNSNVGKSFIKVSFDNIASEASYVYMSSKDIWIFARLF